jgi:hypothetical protein
MRSVKRLNARPLGLAWAIVFALYATDRATAAVSDVLACRGIADNAARLACFDRESARIASTSTPAANTLQPTDSQSRSTAVTQTPSAALVLDPQHTFGLSSAELSTREVAVGARPHEVSSITAHITGLTTAANGRVVFTLDDDQVWEQLLSEGDLNAIPGETVQISRGAFGSYWLKAQSGRGCKVRRLR